MENTAIFDNRINTEQDKTISKIRSEKGASISFALLLFLVCAAVSAAILVAGTTASGRMAGIAETDQKYYSVTSAANMIKDMMDRQVVSTFKLKSIDYRFCKSMGAITDEDLSKFDPTAKIATLPEYIANEYKSNPDGIDGLSITLSYDGKSKLYTRAVVSIDKYGNTTFKISNYSEDVATPLPYTLIIRFSATVDNGSPGQITYDPNSPPENCQQITYAISSVVSDYDATLSTQ